MILKRKSNKTSPKDTWVSFQTHSIDIFPASKQFGKNNYSRFFLATIVCLGCGTTPDPKETPPVPDTMTTSLPSTEPLSTSSPVSLPTIVVPRVLSGVELRMPRRRDPQKTEEQIVRDMDIQVFFPRESPLPVAGELADIVGPKGYRFLAKISYVREAIHFEKAPFNPVGLGYYAKLVPFDHIASDFDPKIERALVLIPSASQRITHTQTLETAPELQNLPKEFQNAKLFSYADTDGDGTADTIAATEPQDCRYAFFLEEDTWVVKRNFCGKNPILKF